MANIVAKVGPLAQQWLTHVKPKAALFWRYAKVEMAPPTPADIPKAFSGLRSALANLKSGRYKQLTVREAWLNTVVGVEVAMWFFIGECIGKRHLRGYKV